MKGALSNPIPMIMRSSEHMQQIRTALVGMPQPSATLTRLQSSEDALASVSNPVTRVSDMVWRRLNLIL